MRQPELPNFVNRDSYHKAARVFEETYLKSLDSRRWWLSRLETVLPLPLP